MGRAGNTFALRDIVIDAFFNATYNARKVNIELERAAKFSRLESVPEPISFVWDILVAQKVGIFAIKTSDNSSFSHQRNSIFLRFNDSPNLKITYREETKHFSL